MKKGALCLSEMYPENYKDTVYVIHCIFTWLNIKNIVMVHGKVTAHLTLCGWDVGVYAAGYKGDWCLKHVLGKLNVLVPLVVHDFQN
jgi:hypothetical protein